MSALITVHNDGPDACEVRIAGKSRLLYAGQDLRVGTSATVNLAPLQQLAPGELEQHMGGSAYREAPCRHIEDT